MKVTVKQQPEEFKPVTLEIALETKEELEAMYQMVNLFPDHIEDRFKDNAKFEESRNLSESIFNLLRKIR